MPANAVDFLKSGKTYMQYAAARQKDSDISKLPVPERGVKIGAEWRKAKAALGMPVTATPKRKTATKPRSAAKKTTTRKTTTASKSPARKTTRVTTTKRKTVTKK